jgi:hypothetical protein
VALYILIALFSTTFGALSLFSLGLITLAIILNGTIFFYFASLYNLHSAELDWINAQIPKLEAKINWLTSTGGDTKIWDQNV